MCLALWLRAESQQFLEHLLQGNLYYFKLYLQEFKVFPLQEIFF